MGYSHSPASRPRLFRRRRATAPSRKMRNTVRSSTRRAFLAAFTGSSPVRSVSRATQNSLAGHWSHRGAPLGRHTVAPNSIRAWLKSPGASTGMTRFRAAPIRALVSGFIMSPSSPVMRATTRSTLPSTAGSGMPKAMEEMAPAV